ncbi:transcription antitermination factor NusB [Planctomicrobium piriforme]|uniref:Transcription antitermination protein NusB n=1 Tax=Planctomicrobium piriforme TaxID=1576369 RepID=A0A1I3HYK6_9PLAN|nr:transcription antitermination factor NusB [Planctomicrobium piriforme]SFI40670.1 N utilization substance protein B [Planctomicrobium piriforme]
MSKRSKARQVAVQMLYQVDLNPDVGGKTVREMIDERLNDQPIRDFAWGLFAGVMEHRPQLDDRIQAVAENWKLNRMAATDRAVLRLGAFELQHTTTPVGVVIDEAVELAKKFGSRQSSQFVNGILDRLIPAERRKQPRPAAEGSAVEEPPVEDSVEELALPDEAAENIEALEDGTPDPDLE